MKPQIGRIVIIRDKAQPDREFAGIVSRVWGDTPDCCINAHVCFDGGMSVVSSVTAATRDGAEGASVTWAWPDWTPPVIQDMPQGVPGV